MLTPLQALLSAVLTGLIVQYLSVKYGFPEELEIINVKELRTIDRSVPITLQLSTCLPDEEPSVEVNKVLDAIFVTHGIETEIEKHLNSELVPKTLNESNFSSIYSGNWLILAHVPWYPSAKNYLNHFLATFPAAVATTRNSNLNLAVLDCHANPLLAAALNVRQYPSLHLVTESGRLREWPFDLKPLDQESLRFIVHEHWKHLPVYQRIKPISDKQALLLPTLQIKTFNSILNFIMNQQPKVFNWIVNNRPLTGGILSGTVLLTTLLFTCK